MKSRVLFGIFILIFVIGLVVPLEAQQQQKKKDRWELELSYGSFYFSKSIGGPENLIHEKNRNPDINLAFRLRVWKGWYVGVLAGVKKEILNSYFTTEVYTNYFWLEDRFGNFLAKDYIFREITTLKTAPFLGIETKLNLFTINLTKGSGLTSFGKIGVKKWFSVSRGFINTLDYTLYDLDRSTTVPYVFYHGEIIPLGDWKCRTRQTVWAVNADGSRGEVVYDEEWVSFITNLKAGIVLFYGGGISLKFDSFFLSGNFQIETRQDIELYPPAYGGKSEKMRRSYYVMGGIGVGYRF